MLSLPSGSLPLSAPHPRNWFARSSSWIPPQRGTCVDCGKAHVGAVLEGDRCSRCPGRIGPTTSNPVGAA